MAKGNTQDNRQKVIDLLNEGRASELGAILQYMAHHYELEDTDYGKLAKIMKTVAIEEMKHAEKLAERILFLGGVPTTKPTPEVKKGQAIPQMLATDKALEQGAVDMYNHHARACADLGDQVSKDIFEELLGQEEAHWDQFDTIADHIEKIGAPYMATLTGGSAE
jgi:bacterioferritin